MLYEMNSLNENYTLKVFKTEFLLTEANKI